MIKQLLLEALERLATGFFVGIGFAVAAAIVFTLWAVPAPAYGAEDVRLYGGGYSHHLISEKAANESHDLGAIQYGSYVAGRFNNSFGNESYFVAYEMWTGHVTQYLEWFVWGGAVAGYPWCDVCPLPAPGLRYTRWQVEPVAVAVGDAATLAAAWRF